MIKDHQINDGLILHISDDYKKQPIRKFNEWIEAMSVSNAVQAKSRLATWDVNEKKITAECCLGVYCRVLGLESRVPPVPAVGGAKAIPLQYYGESTVEEDSKLKKFTSTLEWTVLPEIVNNPPSLSAGLPNIVRLGVSVTFTSSPNNSDELKTIYYGIEEEPYDTLTLATLNDVGVPFKDIAKVIELLYTSND